MTRVWNTVRPMKEQTEGNLFKNDLRNGIFRISGLAEYGEGVKKEKFLE